MKNLRIAYSSGKGVVSWLIRVFTRSNVNHTLFLVEEDGVELVIGADWNGVVMQTRAKWERGGSRVVEVPPVVMDLDAGIPHLLELLDTPYDYTGLFGMPIVLMGRYWFHRRWRNPLNSRGALFCSETAATLLKEMNYPGAESLDPSATDPGALRDFQNRVAAEALAKKPAA